MSNFTKLKLCHTLGISQSTHIWVKGALTALLLVLCGNVAKAQTDLTFKEGIRYSQWVIESRLGDFYGNRKKFGFTTYDRNLKTKNTVSTWYKEDGKSYDIQVDYVAGLVAKATIEAAEYYKNFDWSKPWFKSVEWYGNQCTVPTSPNNLDAINASKMYFGIYNLASGTFKGDAESNTASNATTQLGNALAALSNYNNKYVFAAGTTLNGKDIAGGWFHKESYLNEMWLDGQYMGPATLAQLINGYSSYPNNELTNNDWDLITKQFTIVWNMCWDDTEKLLYHAFCSEARSNTWAANAEIWTTAQKNTSSWQGMTAAGHSAAFWGRAEGWYFLALVDVLEQMQKAGLDSESVSNHDCYKTLKGYLDQLAAGIMAKQDKTSGCWYQLIAMPGDYSASYYGGKSCSATSNYLESSCTAIFAAAYLKAIRLRLLDKTTYEDTAKRAYQGMIKQFMKQLKDGTVELLGCCKSAGLGTSKEFGNDKFRDGSNAYYLLGADVPQTSSSNSSDHYTEGKVLGAFILAATEYERLYQSPMLLSKDLNKKYSLGPNESLSAEVLGEGTATYQWHNANTTPTAIDGATSASYTPTKNGKYYCVITVTSPSSTAAKTRAASTYEITTNTADVTVESTGTETGGTETSNDIFSLTVTYNQEYILSSGADLKLTSDYATVTGGSALVHNGRTQSAKIIYLNNSSGNIALNGSSATYVKLTLNTPLKEGDVIKFTSDESSIGSFYLTTTSANDKKCSVSGGTYTVTSSDGLANSTELYVWNNSSGKFKSITITRSGSSTDPTPSSNASATFTYNGSALSFTDNVATINLGSSQANSKITVNAAPATGATIAVKSGNTSIAADNTITITTPAAGSNASYAYTVTAADGKTTQTYTINVNVAAEVVGKLYSRKVTSSDTAPQCNESWYITGDTENDKLVKMTFGGWKYNSNKYLKPNADDIDANYITDEWSAPATQAKVNALDGYEYAISGKYDAVHEDKTATTEMYGKTRYGWFVSPERVNGITTKSFPFTLPVRGAYMTFEPTKNGTLTIYLLQNGAWNSDSNNDIIPGEFRMHAFQITNQRGLVLEEFAPQYEITVNQQVKDGYTCSKYAKTDKPSTFNKDSKDIKDWKEFWDLSEAERKAVHDNWNNGTNGSQTIIKLENGSFLAIQKAIVKYQFHVTGNETYYMFSNFSKLGFSGATFQPDDAQPTDDTTFSGKNSLSDDKAYTKINATKLGTTIEGSNLYDYKYTIGEGESAQEVGKVAGVFIPQFKEITLNRTFKPNQWTTLTLPFNLTETEVQNIFGEGTRLVMLHDATLQNGGARLTFIYHEIQNVLPGYPYLIKPKQNVTSFTANNKCINPHISQFEVNTTPYTFKGTPDYCTADKTNNDKTGYSVNYAENDIFVSEGNGNLYVSGGASYGKGYRAWLQHNGTTAVKSISVVMSSFSDDDDTTTSIDVAEMAPDLIEALGIQTGVYNLSGQRVANDTRNLKAGIYIVNGKKTVVR